MTSRYDEPKALRPHVCPWCMKRFDHKKALQSHMKATKHGQFVGSQEDRSAAAKLQHLHQDRVQREKCVG